MLLPHNKNEREQATRRGKKVVVEINVSHDIFVLLVFSANRTFLVSVYTLESGEWGEKAKSDLVINHMNLRVKTCLNNKKATTLLKKLWNFQLNSQKKSSNFWKKM